MGIAPVNQAAQVFAHNFELGNHSLDVFRRHAFERARHRVLTQRSKLFEQRPRRAREKQALGAPVVRIGPPFDEAAVAKVVEQPRQRDGRRSVADGLRH